MNGISNCLECLGIVGESLSDAQCLELSGRPLCRTDVNDKSGLLWDLAAHTA